MSWLFSQVLVEEFSEDISLDGAPSALWNGTPMQLPSWCNVRSIDACRLFRSGMMFKPLTDDLGEAVLMSFLEASPVKTSAQPEKERESKGRDHPCGSTWRELLVKYDPDSSSWKTAHCLWDEDLPESSVTLPRWGMMRSGECWEREMPEHLTSGIGSGLWPTPTTIDNPQLAGQGKAAGNPKRGTTLGGAVRQWQTPTCEDAGREGSAEGWEKYKGKGQTSGCRLRNQVAMWPTPTKGMHKQDVNDNGRYAMDIKKKGHQIMLPAEVKLREQQMWPTPVSTEARQGYQERREGAKGSQVSLSRVAIDQEGGREVHGSGPGSGQLNPTWTEAYLMGWPIAWTSMEPMPKEVFQEWERTFLTGAIDSSA